MEGQSILGGMTEARNDSRDLLLCEAVGIRAEGTVKWKLDVFFQTRKRQECVLHQRNIVRTTI